MHRSRLAAEKAKLRNPPRRKADPARPETPVTSAEIPQAQHNLQNQKKRMGIIDRSAQISRMAEAVRVSENDHKRNGREKH